MRVHCEGEGGTGSAFLKGYNNANTNHNCYSFVVIRNESILKTGEESSLLFSSVPTSVIISKLLKYFKYLFILSVYVIMSYLVGDCDECAL